jgi:hypothetical protein
MGRSRVVDMDKIRRFPPTFDVDFEAEANIESQLFRAKSWWLRLV